MIPMTTNQINILLQIRHQFLYLVLNPFEFPLELNTLQGIWVTTSITFLIPLAVEIHLEEWIMLFPSIHLSCIYLLTTQHTFFLYQPYLNLIPTAKLWSIPVGEMQWIKWFLPWKVIRHGFLLPYFLVKRLLVQNGSTKLKGS